MTEKNKKPYEKPVIKHEEKVETLAAACGVSSNEKASFGATNPRYGTPCFIVHS